MPLPIARALLSVSDKTGIIDFARFLIGMGVELLSTGGTAKLLADADIPVREVAGVTQFPEMMDGRVKTLHPAIHGGLLARRDDAAHLQSAADYGIGLIDLLVVNLYPFAATLAQTDDDATLVENIDIGGPAMIRAAAKNHASVTVLTDPADYAAVQQLLQQNKGVIPLSYRRRFAAQAYAHTGSYDTLIASWLCSSIAVPEGEETVAPWPAFLLDARLHSTLRYGENPHQKAALYRRLVGKGGIAQAEQLQGKELSYNNLQDAEAAWQIVATLAQPAVSIIKHANPSGVAVGATASDAFYKALASDPVSAFGGILASNQTIDIALVDAIGSLFLEVIIAPAITDTARSKLATKKNLRVLLARPEQHPSPLSGWMIQAISGGYLVQENDSTHAVSDHPAHWKLVSGTAPDSVLMQDAALAWHVARYVKSNAIVLVKNGATIGIGAGQMSRVDSVRLAVEKARQHGHTPRGCVMASDAFFPFADNVELAAEAGVATLVQPGGSVRDAEVIAAAKQHGITMLLTGTRHFRH